MFFEPLVREGYEWINTCDPNDYEVFLTFDGTRRAETWTPVKVRRVRSDPRHDFKPSDFPWLGSHALILRKAAADALSGLLAPHAEVLPLSTDDGVELVVLNVTRVLDALDEDKSSIIRFPTTNRIMRVTRPVFRPSIVDGADLFRLPHLRSSPTYVSRHFVERVEAAALQGVVFNPIGEAAP